MNSTAFIPELTSRPSNSLVTFALIVVAAILVSYAKRTNLDTIPSPPGAIPLFGHAIALGTAKEPRSLLQRMAWIHGPVTRISVFGEAIVLISDTQYIATLLRKADSVLKPSPKILRAYKSIGLGHSITVIDGPEKRILRRLIERPFAAPNVTEMRRSIVHAGMTLRKDLQDGVANGKAQESSDPMWFEKSQMDFLRLLKKTTFNAMMVLAYGLEYEEYSKLISLDDMELFTRTWMKRMTSSFAYWKYFKPKIDRDAEEAIQRLRAGSDTIIQMAMGKEERAETRLLKGFLANQCDQTGKKLDYDVLIDNVLATLLAGYDTTANTLFSIMHWLAKEPKVQEKVQEEVDRVLKTFGKIDDIWTLNPKEAFKYTHAVVRETNRLTPFAFAVDYSVAEDIHLDKFLLPKGTLIMLMHNIAMQKSSKLEDRFAFRPERWFELDSNEELRKQALCGFMPFGGGPHICPGRHLAIAEMVYFVVMLCADFSVSYRPAPNFVHNLAAGLEQMPLRVQKRA